MHKARYLDGLRGVAALIVVFHHFVAAFYPAAYLGLDLPQHGGFEGLLLTSPLGVFIGGNFSVCVFFVLSGFVLSIAFFKKGDTGILSSLAYRRYVRLLPPVLLSCLIAWALMSLGLMPSGETASITGSSRWLATNWNFAPSLIDALREAFVGVFFQHQARYNNVLWTMSYEFFGSFLVFAVAAVFGKTRGRFLAYGVLLVLLHKTYYFAFVLGMAMADVQNTVPSWYERLSKLPLCIGLFFLGLYLGGVPPFADIQSPWYEWTKMVGFRFFSLEFWHMIGAFFVLLSVLSSPFLQGAFARPLPLWLGKVSFSLYAFHVLVIGSLSSYLFMALAGPLGYNPAALITLWTTLAVSYGIAAVVNRYIDEPGMRLSKKLEGFFL